GFAAASAATTTAAALLHVLELLLLLVGENLRQLAVHFLLQVLEPLLLLVGQFERFLGSRRKNHTRLSAATKAAEAATSAEAAKLQLKRLAGEVLESGLLVILQNLLRR